MKRDREIPKRVNVSSPFSNIFCTGTWRTTEDLLDNNEAYAATLANFVATDDCPAALIESLKEAKKRFDKKKGKPAKRYRVSPNNASQFDHMIFK